MPRIQFYEYEPLSIVGYVILLTSNLLNINILFQYGCGIVKIFVHGYIRIN